MKNEHSEPSLATWTGVYSLPSRDRNLLNFECTDQREHFALMTNCGVCHGPPYVIAAGSALGHRACRLGHSTIYRSAHELLQLRPGRGDGSYDKRLARLSDVDLLIVDDLFAFDAYPALLLGLHRTS